MKLAIFGIGHVGAHVAYTIASSGISSIDEILIFDINDEKVVSEINDFEDCFSYFPHRIRFSKGKYEDLKDVDIIINSVGKIEILSETADRVAEMKFTVNAVESFIDKIRDSGFNGIFVNITNPCDIITKICAKHLNLPKGRVFGTGTALDSARLTTAISRKTGIDAKSISAFMIGEHGNKQIAAWSAVSINGISLDAISKQSSGIEIDRDEIEKEAINAGWVTYNGKKCTEYAIAQTAARFVSAIAHDEKRIIAASIGLNGTYGEKDVFVGVPCVIGKNGVEKIIALELSKEEAERFHKCCEAVRENEKKFFERKTENGVS